MAASVRVEDEAFSDRRYNRLARLAGLADADHARGKLLVLWRQCTIENQEHLPVEDVLDVLGENGVDALVQSNLGVLTKGGRVRIKGTRGRIEWLQKLRENGKKGGRPRKKQKVPKVDNQEVSKSEPLGSETNNPPAPAPAPAPAHKDNTLSKVEPFDAALKPKAKTRQAPELALKAAEYLRARILERAPNCTASRNWSSSKNSWALKLDELNRINQASWQEIRETIDWLHDGENGFIVQSANALRKKWDSIQVNRNRPKPFSNGAASRQPPERML